MSPLRTAADLLRTLESGCYRLPELYQLAEQAGLADRADGRRVIQDGQEQYKRRIRSALQALRRQGRARPHDDRRAAWLIEGVAATVLARADHRPPAGPVCPAATPIPVEARQPPAES
ncbi:hypothetical protein [Micromonospora aurantiaca (nom. illeg.)]|uniref:hypothetical protein n=1 Tax=Micromonospora aurantiaca (nom. illeg.) TaxID=47850 RepID=UPI0001BF2401|nr:hypothetical protein [Micromonospora aurantiaca]ADL47644.1 translation initiation factor IF-2 [Micromonospora aurantiaca ATCC 27029]